MARVSAGMALATHIFGLTLVLAIGSVAGAEPNEQPKELVTAVDAVLCLDAGSLAEVVALRGDKNQARLRSLGCLKSPAGIPATLINGSETGGAWGVRFRPQGMSGGVKLWGRPSAFTLPDGTPLRSLRAAN